MRSSTLSVLIVDDQMTNIVILKRALEKAGYVVFFAQNSAEGMAVAREEKPNIILLDIIMPEEDGYDTLLKLKAESQTSHIPVIFITAKDDIESKLKGFDLGAVDYITKPFNIHEIRARIRVHLQLSLMTQTVIEHQAQSLKEISLAQQSILKKPSDLPAAQFGVVYQSLAAAGGDFYEVIQVAENIFGYFVGDVSGHDIATSFVTPALKALLSQNCKLIYSPMESMRLINGVLLETMPSGKYLTGCYVQLNRHTRRINLINMAHPPILFAPVNEAPQLIECDGDILGAFSEVAFGEKILKCQQGDRFFIYSDGLLERKKLNNVWTHATHELLELGLEAHAPTLQQACDAIQAAMAAKFGQSDDDVVVLGVEI